MSFFKALLATTLGVFIALFIFILLSFGILVAIVVSVGKSNETVSVPSGSVLKMAFSGAIPEQPVDNRINSILGEESSLSIRQYMVGLDHAIADKRINGLVVNVYKFDGSWAQAQELRAKLAEFRESGKFIYAIGGVGGFSEKEYYLATVADSIILNPAGEIEINGIYATLAFFKPVMDKLGIEANVVRVGSYKSAVEPFINESASPQNVEMTTALVNGIFGEFKQTVRASRKLTQVGLDSILDRHSLLTSREALRLHLVDAILYDDQVDDLIIARANRKAGTKHPTVDFNDYTKSADVEGDENSGSEIALVYADGGIAAGESGYNPQPLFGGQQLGSQTFIEAIREARDAKNVKAIVLRINSPGGDAAASEAMWREVKLAEQKKPVIVSMGSLAASGGYFVAAAADTIIAEPTTLTGSIGAFGLWFNLQKFYRNTIGINLQVIKTNPNADMLSSAEPPSELERAIMTKQIDTVYQHFLKIVAEGRHMSVESVDKIAQGRVWTGREALNNGLVDMLGGLDKAIQVAAARVGLKAGGYEVRTLPHEKGFLQVVSRIIKTQAPALFASSTPLDTYRETIEALNSRKGIQTRMVDITIR